MLSDVVVTGFQTISKERATGAFDIIKQGTLDKPSATIADRLVGRVAGVQASTTADGDISFTIRGRGHAAIQRRTAGCSRRLPYLYRIFFYQSQRCR